MKKVVALVLAVLMLTVPFGSVVFAEEIVTISGVVDIECDSANTLVIDGKTIYTGGSSVGTVVINVTGVDYQFNTVYLNETRLGVLVEGENRFEFAISSLKDGNNEIRVELGTPTAVFDSSLSYGQYNLDDLTINSVAFSGITITNPSSVKKYLPIVGATGTIVTEAEYTESLRIGDGWSAETGLGGSIPETPIFAGYIFEKPNANIFRVDTTVFDDGEYEAIFYENSEVCETRKYIIDNNAPIISFSIPNGSVVSPLDTVTFSVADASETTTTLYVDDVLSEKIDLSALAEGSHTAYVIATDAQGFSSGEILVFNMSDKHYSVNNDGNTVNIVGQDGATIYGGTLLSGIHMYENPLGIYNSSLYTDTNEALVSFDNKQNIKTSSIGNRVPYHSFVVDTTSAVGEDVVVSYSGESGSGTGILLKAWNYKTSSWDKIARTGLDGSVTFKANLSTYSKNGKMKVIATPDIVYNGSDTLLWNSDTQYYSRFEDLNDTYYAINEYAVDLYNKGDIGYCVHTGDLMDQTYVGDDVAHKEYSVADKAQAILDNALVPNGVVSGNHDITHSTADYSYYWQYFGADRYKDFDWYGGSLNDNMHHYDLVSLGSYDFVFLYIGTYKETEADTIAWANSVCKAYPDRNVILCTHEYITPNGTLSDYRAQSLWDNIIVPNENIVMVLCGHHPGVRNQLRRVGNTDRYVAEILADYQYVDLKNGGNGVSHEISGYPLDGEGFVRLMSFTESGDVTTSTYSPVADMNGYYSANQETFVYNIDMVPANRYIVTNSFDVLTDVSEKGTVSNGNASISDCDGFYLNTNEGDLSEIFVLNEYSAIYTSPERRNYKLSPVENFENIGFENINENLHPDQVNDRSKLSSNITVGFDLLKNTNSTLSQTSGSTNVSFNKASDGTVTITHQYGNGGENWVTLMNAYSSATSINLTTNNRLYFGVTANTMANWNIYINFADSSLVFASNSTIVKMFGDVNNASGKMSGTWNGYIDLSSIVTGTKTVNSIYLVSSTPGETVKFDYLFFGKSSEGKVRFIIDENTIGAKEAPVGSTISVPGSPYKVGYAFDGWYTADGTKVSSVTVASTVTTLYARFIELHNDIDCSNDVNYDPTVYSYPLWVTHFDVLAEGAGSVMTVPYSDGGWSFHIALTPTDIAGTYEVTAMSNGMYDGSGKAQAIPEGGFVYVINVGNDYTSLGGVNYQSTACRTTLSYALAWKLGDKITIGNLSTVNKVVPTTTPDIEWYYDDYQCTATFDINITSQDNDDDDNGDENGDGIPDSFGVTIDSVGRYTFDNAYGYTFNIDTSSTFASENTVVIRDAATYANSNPNWAISVVLVPTGDSNEYKVETIIENPGSVPTLDFGDGRIVLVSHSSASMPKVDNGDGTFTVYENWMSRVAAKALSIDDVLVFNEDMTTATVFAPEEEITVLLGDVNGDNKITTQDYLSVKRHVMGTFVINENSFAAADVNKDNTISITDYTLIKRHIMETFVIKQ